MEPYTLFTHVMCVKTSACAFQASPQQVAQTAVATKDAAVDLEERLYGVLWNRGVTMDLDDLCDFDDSEGGCQDLPSSGEAEGASESGQDVDSLDLEDLLGERIT